MLLYEMFEDSKELTFMDALAAFLPLAMDHLGLEKLPTIHLRKDLKTKHLPSFGQFTNDDNVINVDIENRHPNDVLRTLAHELTHYWQNTQNMLGAQSWQTGSPDEDQANAEAGVIMRKFNQSHPEFMRLKPIVINQQVDEKWSEKYKRSINCNNPKGFSQRAHCQGRKKANESTVDSVEIVHEPSRNGYYIEAQIDGREVGRVWFNPTKDGYRASMAWVSSDLRRQGIARKMYQYARDTLGLNIVPSDVQSDDARAFWATNPVEENFADGKKPGRKGLAKRVGVDCGQSISKLRSIAKSSSGERQRMAHWCANMKSGKQK